MSRAAQCPITVHMDCRLTQLRQTAGEVTATFSNGRTATGEVLVGAVCAEQEPALA